MDIKNKKECLEKNLIIHLKFYILFWENIASDFID